MLYLHIQKALTHIMIEYPKIPRHIAIIMDGNGRWAKNQGHDRLFGHKNGVESVRSTINRCASVGVEFLTLYVFSAENWGRPQDEVDGLMTLLCQSVSNEVDELVANGIRMRIIGDRESMPADVVSALEWLETRTAGGKNLTVMMAINYGSHNEITRAARLIAEEVAEGRYGVEEVTCEKIAEHLYTVGCPDPDLVIRTGGECRLSNFLLWQAAYAELYFTDTFWPDFGAEQLDEAIAEYSHRERRFGKIEVNK